MTDISRVNRSAEPLNTQADKSTDIDANADADADTRTPTSNEAISSPLASLVTPPTRAAKRRSRKRLPLVTRLLLALLPFVAQGLAIVLLLSGCGGGSNQSNSNVGGNGGGAQGGGYNATGTTPGLPAISPSTLVTSLPVAVSTAAYASASWQQQALDKLNAVRAHCGFGLLAHNPQLDIAAQHHADYLFENLAVGRYQAYSHTEVPGWLAFTGVSPQDRVNAAGYTGIGSEGLGGGYGVLPTQTMASLLNSSYHLANALRGYREVGFGSRSGHLLPASNYPLLDSYTVANYGYAPSEGAQALAGDVLASYPCQGSQVMNLLHGPETPNPLQGINNTGWELYRVGHPLFFKVRSGQVLEVSSITLSLVNADGTLTPAPIRLILTQANDPNHLLDTSEVVGLPDAPLAASSTYKVVFVGHNNGVPVTRSFSFTTPAADAVLPL